MIRLMVAAVLVIGLCGFIFYSTTVVVTTCAPYENFGAAPYENFATPPYQTGC